MSQKLEDCRRIFLDSTVISDLLNLSNIGKYGKAANDRLKTVKALIQTLSDNKATSGERIFLISTISISEVFATKEGDYKAIYEAIQILIGSNNIDIISYSRKISILHNEVFREKTSDKEIDKLKIETGYSESKYVNIRERIRKDYLIVATALSQRPDVVFTADNGFAELCKKMGLNCVVTERGNFIWNQGDDKIYGFT
jgi:hypothetical protein